MSRRELPGPRQPSCPPFPILGSPWLAGALIGMTIMTMVGSAISMGAGLALAGATVKQK
jgi:hypothetical protein